ncbi:hypothetical protein BU16DRAFT_563286 [Lophium mytilinum]|uniref:Uncharacterized protein n=1 Tax=Lophium mytilinum TaxID=390894 RepID=A0A6A6QLW1_9PEZI|nr:hypothetical protein BU16DRAFT_563286 [Lophium mytilinum]
MADSAIPPAEDDTSAGAAALRVFKTPSSVLPAKRKVWPLPFDGPATASTFSTPRPDDSAKKPPSDASAAALSAFGTPRPISSDLKQLPQFSAFASNTTSGKSIGSLFIPDIGALKLDPTSHSSASQLPRRYRCQKLQKLQGSPRSSLRLPRLAPLPLLDRPLSLPNPPRSLEMLSLALQG